MRRPRQGVSASRPAATHQLKKQRTSRTTGCSSLHAERTIGRALTLRPLRGELNDPENLSLLLGLVALLSAESLFWFTSIGGTFAAHALYWPFSLVLARSTSASGFCVRCRGEAIRP